MKTTFNRYQIIYALIIFIVTLGIHPVIGQVRLNNTKAAKTSFDVGVGEIKIISVKPVTIVSSGSKTLKAKDGKKLILVRTEIHGNPDQKLFTTNRDFTLRYRVLVKSYGTTLKQIQIRPCEGIRWHGPKIDESKDWQLLLEEDRGDSIAVGSTMRSSGNDYLDLLFRVHKEAEGAVLLHTKEVDYVKLE